MIIRLTIFLLTLTNFIFSIETQIAIQQDTHPLTIGQISGFRFNIQAPTYIDNIIVDFAQADLEILKQETNHRKLSNDIEIWEINYQVAFFNTGKIPVGPFEIKFFQQGKLIWKEQINRIHFQINSLLKAEEKLHDVKPPLNLEVDQKKKKLLLIRSGLVLATTLLIITLFFLVKKIKKIKKELSPAQKIWMNLNRLYKKSTIEQTNLRQLFFEISTTLKEYLSFRWQIPAEQLTHRELIYFLPKMQIPHKQNEYIIKFLRFSEQVKYARHLPAKKEIITQLKTFEELINEIHHDLFPTT